MGIFIAVAFFFAELYFFFEAIKGNSKKKVIITVCILHALFEALCVMGAVFYEKSISSTISHGVTMIFALTLPFLLHNLSQRKK